MAHILYKDVTLKLGPKLALDSVDLDIDNNEIVGLLSKSRQERTILLSMLTSLRYPTKGEITADGKNVFDNSAIMSKISFTWAGQRIRNKKKVGEAFKFCSAFKPNWDMEYTKKLMLIFDLTPSLKLKQMSISQRSAFNVICGLSSRAEITIFDGTYLGLNDDQKQLFFKELKDDHNRYPRTMILATDKADEIQELLQDVIIMSKGKIIGHATVDEILNAAQEYMEVPERPTLQEVFQYFTNDTSSKKPERDRLNG